MVRRGSVYYYVESHDRRIWISRSSRLADVFTAPARAVWSAPDTGWNRTNVWAPELHFIDGRWYIYYAAGRAGPPFTSQHAGVLQSESDEPFGAGSIGDRSTPATASVRALVIAGRST